MKKIQSPKTIKNTGTILNDLIEKFHYQPLKTLLFCKDFLNSLAPSKRQLIAKIYIKNKILNIVALHSVAFQELNHDDSKINIKILINKYASLYPLSGFSDIKDIRIFTQKYRVEHGEEIVVKRPYIELSLGEFKNKFENEKLAKKFEELRQIIKNGSYPT